VAPELGGFELPGVMSNLALELPLCGGRPWRCQLAPRSGPQAPVDLRKFELVDVVLDQGDLEFPGRI